MCRAAKGTGIYYKKIEVSFWPAAGEIPAVGFFAQISDNFFSSSRLKQKLKNDIISLSIYKRMIVFGREGERQWL